MYLDVYVGEYTDSVWDGWSDINNQPIGVSPLFPDPIAPQDRPGTQHPFFDVQQRIEDGIYEGRKVDWGCWVAKVRKKDLLLLVDEYYPEDWLNSERCEFFNTRKFVAELKEAIADLDENKTYLLSAVEL